MSRAVLVLTMLAVAGPVLAQATAPPPSGPVGSPTVPAVRTAPEVPSGPQAAEAGTRAAPLAAPGVKVQPAPVPPAAIGGAATSATQ